MIVGEKIAEKWSMDQAAQYAKDNKNILCIFYLCSYYGLIIKTCKIFVRR